MVNKVCGSMWAVSSFIWFVMAVKNHEWQKAIVGVLFAALSWWYFSRRGGAA